MTTKQEQTSHGTFQWVVERQLAGSNSPWSTYASGSASLGGTTRVTVGQNTSRFYARKRRGELLPFTFFDQYEWDLVNTPGYVELQTTTFTSTTGQRVRYQQWNPGSATTFGTRYKSDLVSYESVVQSLASSASGWDALTFAVEARQLRRLVVSLTQRLSDHLRGRPLKIPANKWLEARYGWRPLYYDMVSINEAINALNRKRKFSTYSSGDSLSDVQTTYSTGTDGRYTIGRTETLNTSINVRARMVMRGELNPISVNPLKTGWELIKLSYVIDWLLSVGKAIDALSLAFSGAHYVAGAGYKATVSNIVSYTQVSVNSGWKMNSFQPGSTSCDGECVSREPAFIPLRPLIHPRLTAGRLVDLIALILQRAL